MLRAWAAALLLGALTPARAAEPACPDVSAGETPEDCPWAALARALRARPAELERLAPGIVRQLEADAKRPAWLSLWGESLNFDENARAVIVAPEILAALAAKLRVPYADAPLGRVHAGLEHTYGYLFSVLRTPYGFKRARWVRGELERGFGLPRGLLGPAPRQGTLLANATYLLGRLAFRGEPAELRRLEEGRRAAAPALRALDFARLDVRRLEEEVALGERRVLLRTDLVAFPSTGTANSRLLVYSVRDERGARLITAFPVAESFASRLLAPAELGDTPVSSRYNAYVPGLTGAARPGKRRLAPYGAGSM